MGEVAPEMLGEFSGELQTPDLLSASFLSWTVATEHVCPDTRALRVNGFPSDSTVSLAGIIRISRAAQDGDCTKMLG